MDSNDKNKIVKTKIRRFDPSIDKNARYDTFSIPIGIGWTVTSVLEYVNEHLNGNVAYYITCRRGICNGCVMKVNGKSKLACMEIVKKDIVLEPINEEKVIKDLICH